MRIRFHLISGTVYDVDARQMITFDWPRPMDTSVGFSSKTGGSDDEDEDEGERKMKRKNN